MKRSETPHPDDPCRQPAAAEGPDRALSAGRARRHIAAAPQIRCRGDRQAAGRLPASTSLTTANSAKPCAGPWITVRGGPTFTTASRASRSARRRPERAPGWTFGSKERAEFAEFYAEDGGMGSAGQTSGSSSCQPVRPGLHRPSQVHGPCAHPARHRQPESGLQGARNRRGFHAAVSPATLQIIPNEHYKSREDYTWALAEAIRDEYKAIIDAGIILQIDDPALVDIYDWWFSQDGDTAGYRKWAEFQVEALNHALRASRRTASVSTSAGEAGMARTRLTSRSRTWSICCSK